MKDKVNKSIDFAGCKKSPVASFASVCIAVDTFLCKFYYSRFF